MEISSGNDIELYLIIPVACAAIVLSFLGVASVKVIEGLTLAILVLIAIALLKGRKLSQEISTSLSARTPGSSAREFFWKKHDVEKVKVQILAARTEVWLWGTTLSMHVSELRPTIEEAIGRGVTIRVLLVPSAPVDALSMAAWRAGHLNTEELEHELSTNLAKLRRTAQKFEKKEGAGRLEVRTLNYLAPYVMYGYDPFESSGLLEVRLSGIRVRHAERASFTLRADTDTEWYSNFAQQMKVAWEHALIEAGEPVGSSGRQDTTDGRLPL
ncbi:hypothetical protein AB0E12_25520 [Micromonospora chersina]|uniref:hypothetical protein n=1 Tax=Micromonospora chersina TaxID=47854 RepID=UPI00340D8DB8